MFHPITFSSHGRIVGGWGEGFEAPSSPRHQRSFNFINLKYLFIILIQFYHLPPPFPYSKERLLQAVFPATEGHSNQGHHELLGLTRSHPLQRRFWTTSPHLSYLRVHRRSAVVSATATNIGDKIGIVPYNGASDQTTSRNFLD